MPGRHVRRVRRPVGAGAEEPVVVVGVDVMGLHHPVCTGNLTWGFPSQGAKNH